jgi:DNA-binding NarL/FixJ family response regulator
MLTAGALIEALVEAGVRGYIFKDDDDSVRQLFPVIQRIAPGEYYFIPAAWERIKPGGATSILTSRQLEVLSISAAYPDLITRALAIKLHVSDSTVRNLLSAAYKRLGVSTRPAAIARANQLGLLTHIYGEPD